MERSLNATVSSRSVQRSLRLCFCWRKVCHRRVGVQTEPPLRLLGAALLNGSRQPVSSEAHLCCLHCLIVWQFLFMLCHFQSSPPSLTQRSLPLINLQRLKRASGRAAGCDRLPLGVTLWILEPRRGQSTLGAVFARKERSCVRIHPHVCPLR